MKCVLVLCLLATAGVTFADEAGETYDPKYDKFDIQPMLENLRLLISYVKCFTGEAACTDAGSSFKRVIPEALVTSCGKCTPKQKELIRKVIKAIQEKLPKEWAKLVKLNDPEGKHKKSFEAFLNAN